MKLSLKLLVIILEISIIPLSITGYISYSAIRQQITQNVLVKIDAIAQIQKNRLINNLNDDEDLLNLFETKSQMRSYLNEYDNSPTPELQKMLNTNIEEAIQGSTSIYKIFIANPLGIVVASTDSALIGKNISGENYFQTGVKENNVSLIAKDPDENRTSRYLSGPLMLNGKIIGISVLLNNNDDITGLVNDYTGLETTGETLLAKNDGSGNALFLTAVRFDKNAALTRIVKKKSTNVAAIHAINGEEKVFTDVADYRGVPVFAATRYIQANGWGIVVKIDKAKALAPLVKLQELFLLILGVIIVLIFIVSWSVSFSITNSIKKLVLASQKIIAGDLSQSLEIKSKDEIGELSRYLSQMVASLENLIEKYKNLNSSLDKEVDRQISKFESQNVFLTEANKAMVNLSEDLEKEKNNLEVSKTNIEAILTGIGDALIATDNNGIITMINPAAEKLFSIKRREVAGKSAFKMLPLEDEEGKIVPEEKRPLKISLAQNKTINATANFALADKTKITLAITSAPIILNKKTIGGVDVLRDITKERDIDRAKTEFVSLASHQLRTPISAIKWYSEMIMEKKTGKLNVKQKRYLHEIYHGNERMIKLINNLLSIARLELGKLTVNAELVDAKKIMEDVVKEQEPDIIKRNHKVTVKEIGAIPKISVDPVMLRMIFQNFVSNAVKYTHAKGKIDCTIEKKDSKILFKVADNGIGIPEKEQKRIFERLFRASNALIEDKEGSGLGLYLVQKVIEALDGKLWFESKEGKGTTFFFELPIKNII